jgi:hypothetical protein
LNDKLADFTGLRRKYSVLQSCWKNSILFS